MADEKSPEKTWYRVVVISSAETDWAWRFALQIRGDGPFFGDPTTKQIKTFVTAQDVETWAIDHARLLIWDGSCRLLFRG